MSKRRIIIFEDEPITAMDEVEIFSRLGYEVVSSHFTADGALDIVTKNRPDAVIMDIMLLGETNGIDAADQIIETHEIPVVFVSAIGRSIKQLSEKKWAGKNVCFVQKPYTEEELKKALGSVLSND